MAAPDAAILQEIARISGAINRAKAANQDSSSSSASTSAGGAGVHSSSSRGRGRHAYNQFPPHGYRGGASYRGRGGHHIPGYQPTGPFRGSNASHYSQHHYPSRGGTRQHTVTRANNTWTAASAAGPSSAGNAAANNGSKHMKLVLNNPAKGKSVSPSTSDAVPLPSDVDEQAMVTGEASTSSADASTVTADIGPSIGEEDITNQTKPSSSQDDEDMEDGEIDESTLPPPEPKKPPISLVKQGNVIIINGVTFVSDASGRKLVRKDSNNQLDTKGKGRAIDDSNNNANMSTPSKTSIDGQAYVRTKSGNLISTAVLKKRQEMAAKKKRINELVAVAKNVQKARQASARAQRKKTLCRYFQKTGVCARAKTCPYMHDSEKVAICPRFLRNTCPLTSGTCPLSHSPNAHRMPHCQHYPNCRRGDSCPYTHVQVSPDAKICKDFVGFGWCEKGDQCTERHVWECPDFEEKGVCNKRGCKLGHVIRRKTTAKDQTAEETQSIPSFMFVDTNPDPSFVRDESITLPESTRKRSASVSIASTEGYSSGEEEAANLVKKKIKIVEVPKDAMEANEDFVTLVFSDMEGEDEEDDDDESEAESGLEEEHLDSISRKIDPTVYEEEEDQETNATSDETAEDEDEEEDEQDSDEASDNDAEDAANTTIKSTTRNKPGQDKYDTHHSGDSASSSESD